jgi:hypothetical protein
MRGRFRACTLASELGGQGTETEMMYQIIEDKTLAYRTTGRYIVEKRMEYVWKIDQDRITSD